MVVRHGSRDVLVDAAEEQVGVLALLSQNRTIVAGVLQLAEVGLADDHHEVLVVVLTQLRADVDLGHDLLQLGRQRSLLVAQRLQHVREVQRLDVLPLVAGMAARRATSLLLLLPEGVGNVLLLDDVLPQLPAALLLGVTAISICSESNEVGDWRCVRIQAVEVAEVVS